MLIKRSRKKRLNNKGVTLEELMLVMACISNILSFVLPGVQGMIKSAQLTKADSELTTLKAAVTSYWRNNVYKYPDDLTSLMSRSDIIKEVMRDPFKTDTSNGSYGYVTGHDSTYGDYFFIYTKGPSRNPTFPSWDSVNGRVVFDGHGIVVSNVDCERTE